jgi:hypothetical protein
MSKVSAICFILAVFLMSGMSFADNKQMMMNKDMMMEQTTGPFSGAKVNGGTVTVSHKNGQHILTLSDDFVPPQTPDPHWQLVDSKGNVYELQKLNIKGDKFNKSIVVPSYIPDIAKVQIWCAFAETLLGEASFKEPVMFMMMK